MNNKALLYTRVSTGEQTTSLQEQREKLLAYCAAKDLDAVEIIVDENVSGGIALDDRPHGARIVELIRTKKITHIVASKLDRIFRDCADCLAKTREWDKQNLYLHLLDISVDTSTPMGRAFLTMAGAFAELERNLIRERTKNGMRHRKQHHKVFNHAPYGFDIKGDDLIPNAAEQKVIRRILKLHEAGKTYRDIAAALNKSGVKTKLGKTWQPGTIHALLKTGLHGAESK